MKTEFTKGEWTVDYGGTVGHIKAVRGIDEKTPTVAIYNIFSKYGGSIGEKHEREEQANAKLIATAPRMFYDIVLLAHKEGWAYLFNIIEDVTGVKYGWGNKKFEKLVNQAKEYLK